jgi:hypothetical protein
LSFEDFVTPTRAPEKNQCLSCQQPKKKKKEMCTRVKEKKTARKWGKNCCDSVFNPIFWVLPVPRLAQNKWAWLIPLALPRPVHSYCFEAIQIVLSAGLRWADFGKNGLS